MFMRNLLLIFTLLQLSLSGVCQFSDNADIREKFSYEIIQIDEFIDRFNFNNDTKLLKYLSENNPDLVLNRKLFMKTLFDKYSDHLKNKEVLLTSFTDFVCSTNHPRFLNFYDKDWYAQVNCIIEYNNKRDTAKLILTNQMNADSSSKWVITAVSSSLLQLPASADSTTLMTPVSHGTDFITLHNIFKDGKNIRNYLASDFAADELSFLAYLMFANQIRLIEISSVKYHFLQIPHWAFTVEYLNRKELNSGWLITDLNYLNNDDKKDYKRDKLFIQTCQ